METGFLGYPKSDEFCGLRDGGCGQRFQGGVLLWSGYAGAHSVHGAFLDEYARSGYESGPLGYPAEEEVTNQQTGWLVQRFWTGYIGFDGNRNIIPVRSRRIVERHSFAIGTQPGSVDTGLVALRRRKWILDLI